MAKVTSDGRERVCYFELMTRHTRTYSFFLVLCSLWWGWTVLVDFVVIRTVFAVVTSFFEAGDLGVAVFSRLNDLELVAATGILALVCRELRRGKKLLPHLALALVAWAIAVTYFAYLTPKLVALTELWKKTDLMSITAVAGIPDVQQEHQFYHRLYIGLDTVKLVVLTGLIALGVWREDRWSA